MSRCFPYPPPGFNGKKAGNETLIESIKLQKEKKAHTEKKEKRREKKDKRRESKQNKEKSKSAGFVDGDVHKLEKSRAEPKGGYPNKRKQDDSEQLERSGITEENGLPLNLQNPSYSSDSTENSNKRRKQDSNVNSICKSGNILRIRLPLQKHNVPDISTSKEQLGSSSVIKEQHRELEVLTRKEQSCSTSGRNVPYDVSTGKEYVCYTSGRIDPPAYVGHGFTNKTSQEYLRTSNNLQGLSSSFVQENGCSTSGSTENIIGNDKRRASSSGHSSRERKMHKLNKLYNSLFQNMVQPVLSGELTVDDDDWLFGRKHFDITMEKRSEGNSDVTCKQLDKRFDCSGVVSSSSNSMLPRAQYLPEAGIYALPYTVPF